MNACQYCGRKRDGTAADYYHEHDCERKHWGAKIEEAKARKASSTELRGLWERYDAASFVGD